MLLHRILTAIILIPLFILAVLKLSPQWFLLLTMLLVILGAWEWSGLMEIKSFPKKIIYPIIILTLLPLSLFLSVTNLLVVSFIWWCSTILLIKNFPESGERFAKSTTARALMGILVLIPCWRAIIFIHAAKNNGPYVLLFLFVLIWGADSAAYFVGRKWGKTKLAPRVSPGKTWEGFYGALVMTLIIALLALYFSHTPYRIWIAAILLSLITVIFSVIGDLFESMLKRQANLKDSGVLIPGHGGVLDRIDSLTAAAPVFALGAIILGKIFHS